MKTLAKALLREFDISPSQISEAEEKAVLNVVVIPLFFLGVTSNILVSLTWVILISFLYLTKLSQKKQNASAFFTLLSYVSVSALIAALAIVILTL